MSKSKAAVLFLAVMCMSLSGPPSHSQSSYEISHTADFSEQDFSFSRVGEYDLVRLTRGGYLADLGKPMLPSKEIRLALPAGMKVGGVLVLGSTQKEIEGEFDILPAQLPREIGASGQEADFVQPDQQIYQSDRPYPAVLAEFVRQTDLAGQNMAVIRLFPLQYKPAEKRLTLHTSIDLVIQGGQGYQCKDYLSPNVSERGKRDYQRTVENMVENPQEVNLQATAKSTTTQLPAGGPFDHLIITSSSFASDFQPLVDWHTRKGVRDTVITVDWIYSNYDGSFNQEKIRNFVADAHAGWGTSYLLLGGEHETVPFEYRAYSSDESPGDQYYSDYDDDWTHELAVGRATVSSSTEVNTFVDKVLKYEKDPPLTDYPQDILLIGMDYDASTHVEYLKMVIDSYIPLGFNMTTVYDSHTGNHRDNVLAALNSGQNLVNHSDHSYISYMGTGNRNHDWGINSSDVDALTNDDQLSVVVSTGCHPNHMDYNDCIAEHFVIHNPNQGAVAFTGNARSGYYYSGDPFSLSNGLDLEWWIALFDGGVYNIGQTLVEAKHNFEEGGSGGQHSEWTFNLLGEPEMPLWTGAPDSLDVIYPDTLLPDSAFSVRVENATYHHGVGLAYVCLWKENEVYLTGQADYYGDITFQPSPLTEGIMLVTASKRNYLAYEGEAYVYPPSYVVGDANGDKLVDLADAIFLLNYLFRGDLPPVPLAAGDVNCDELIELADVIYLLNYLFKGGSAPGCS